jgi:hemerythrin
MAMSIFSWNTDWDTGNQMIDDQHRELLSRFEGLANALLRGTSNQEVARLFDFLSEYVESHFASEEALMNKLNYPRLLGHKAVHDDMRLRLAGLASRYRNAPEQGALEVMKFLTDWLLVHMNTEDRLLARYCAEQPD